MHRVVLGSLLILVLGAGLTSGCKLASRVASRVALHSLPRHASWSAWARFDRGRVTLGVYETATKKPVSTGGTANVSSFRNQTDGTPIHSEAISFDASDAVDGVIVKWSRAPAGVWAGTASSGPASVQYWVVIEIEAGSKAIPVTGEYPPK